MHVFFGHHYTISIGLFPWPPYFSIVLFQIHFFAKKYLKKKVAEIFRSTSPSTSPPKSHKWWIYSSCHNNIKKNWNRLVWPTRSLFVTWHKEGSNRSDQSVPIFLYIFGQKRDDIFSTRTKKNVLSLLFFVFKFFAKIQKKHTLKSGERKTEKQFFYNIAVWGVHEKMSIFVFRQKLDFRQKNKFFLASAHQQIENPDFCWKTVFSWHFLAFSESFMKKS